MYCTQPLLAHSTKFNHKQFHHERLEATSENRDKGVASYVHDKQVILEIVVNMGIKSPAPIVASF